MGEIFVIASGKGGTGKSTVAANIAAGLSGLDKKVCLVDADLGLRNLDILLGLENDVVYTIMDVIEGRCSVTEALVSYKDDDRLFLMPSSQIADKSSIQPEEMKALLTALKDLFDYVIVDSPAGIELGFDYSTAYADKAILVTDPSKQSVRDVDKIKHLLHKKGIYDQCIIINRYRKDLVMAGYMMNERDIAELLGLNLLGVLPEDDGVILSANQGKAPVSNEYQCGKAFANVCRRIVGENVPMLDISVKKGLFSKRK